MVAPTNPLPEGGHVLTFRELTKTFGQTVAVDHVSFDVRSGEIHALVGENGAGKSTLIRMLAGDYSPDSGDILLAGQQVSSPTRAKPSSMELGSYIRSRCSFRTCRSLRTFCWECRSRRDAPG